MRAGADGAAAGKREVECGTPFKEGCFLLVVARTGTDFPMFGAIIKGDVEIGGYEKLAVGFAGGSRRIGIKPEWEKIKIELQKFIKEGEEQELNFIVDASWVSNKKGAFYIDKIVLE